MTQITSLIQFSSGTPAVATDVNTNFEILREANNSLDSSATTQGNIFNGALQLVQLNSSTQLPAVDGSLLINLNASNIATGTLSSSILPIASNSILGGVKVDGTTITINNGTISSYLPTASITTLGGVRVDGTTITINNGTISGANTYTLPTASTVTLGGVKVDGISIVSNNGTISTTGTVSEGSLPPTVTFRGNTFNGASQLVQLDSLAKLPAVDGSQLIDLNASNIATGTLSASLIPVATSANLGVVSVDGTSVISSNGTLSVGIISNSSLPSDATTQGNIFNGALQLVQLNSSTQLPAVDGSLLINLNASNIATGTLSTSLIPVATSANLGVVSVDGVTILSNNGTLTAGVSSYTLPTASTATLGGVKVDGTTIKINEGTVSVGNINSSSLPYTVTTQGNVFNGASQLVQLNNLAKLPAIDGSLLTNISTGNLIGTVSNSNLPVATGSSLGLVQPDNTSISVNSGVLSLVPYSITNTTTNYVGTLTYGTQIILCDATAGALSVTLPTAINNTATYIIKKIDVSANAITILPNGSQTLDLQSSLSVPSINTPLKFISDNLNWWTI